MAAERREPGPNSRALYEQAVKDFQQRPMPGRVRKGWGGSLSQPKGQPPSPSTASDLEKAENAEKAPSIMNLRSRVRASCLGQPPTPPTSGPEETVQADLEVATTSSLAQVVEWVWNGVGTVWVPVLSCASVQVPAASPPIYSNQWKAPSSTAPVPPVAVDAKAEPAEGSVALTAWSFQGFFYTLFSSEIHLWSRMTGPMLRLQFVATSTACVPTAVCLFIELCYHYTMEE